MSEFSDLTGQRDWSTPLPWTGKPVVKTYWDWLRCCYRTDVCILLGAREEPPGKAWGDRPENAGKGRTPDRERRDLSPQGHRAAVNAKQARPGPRGGNLNVHGLRARIRAYLKEHPNSTNVEICAAFSEYKPESVRAILHDDPGLQRTGASGKGNGRKRGEESRWKVKEVADAK